MKKFTILIVFAIAFFNVSLMNAQPSNDNIGSAVVIPHSANWCSADAAYTTVDATPDGNAASCWNTNPNYNVWFTFVATSPEVTVTIDRGGLKVQSVVSMLPSGKMMELQKWLVTAMWVIMMMWLSDILT